MSQPFANGTRQKMGLTVTISTDRFKCLQSIKCAAVHNREKRLKNELKKLAKIEARDFCQGIF